MPEIPVDPSQPLADQQAAALADLKKAQAAEYSQYVAVGPIYYDGALAFVSGQAVPASNVEAHGYLDEGLVRRTSDPEPEPAPAPAPPPQGDPIVINPLPDEPAASKSSADKSSADNK